MLVTSDPLGNSLLFPIPTRKLTYFLPALQYILHTSGYVLAVHTSVLPVEILVRLSRYRFPKATDMAKQFAGRKVTHDLSKEISKSGKGGQGPQLPYVH